MNSKEMISDRDMKIDALKSALLQAFDWEETKKGNEFWGQVYTELENVKHE